MQKSGEQRGTLTAQNATGRAETKISAQLPVDKTGGERPLWPVVKELFFF